MKSIANKTKQRRAFTLIELLTVMSIIVLLFGLLVPSLTMVRRHAKDVKQEAQFHSIETALDLFRDAFEVYPESVGTVAASGATDYTYPGAMTLAEALLGQDLLGYHPSSVFDKEGDSPTGNIYPAPFRPDTDSTHLTNLRSRKGPYLPVDKINVHAIQNLFGVSTGVGSNDPNNGVLVLCDEYPRIRDGSTGKRAGMPILYYKANISNVVHADATDELPSTSDEKNNIYNYLHNEELLKLDVPWEASGTKHPMYADPLVRFYGATQNPKIAYPTPYRPDTYILISAGFDGLYGTEDDVYNFED